MITLRTQDQSCNRPWLGTVTLGDGLHNSHHAFPWSIRNDHCRLQWDGAYWACWLFEKLGLASNLKRPTEQHLLRKNFPGRALRPAKPNPKGAQKNTPLAPLMRTGSPPNDFVSKVAAACAGGCDDDLA